MDLNEKRRDLLSLSDEELGRRIKEELGNIADVALGRHYRRILEESSDEQLAELMDASQRVILDPLRPRAKA